MSKQVMAVRMIGRVEWDSTGDETGGKRNEEFFESRGGMGNEREKETEREALHMSKTDEEESEWSSERSSVMDCRYRSVICDGSPSAHCKGRCGI